MRFSLDEWRLIRALLGVELEAQESLGMEGDWSGRMTSDLYRRIGRVIESKTGEDDPDT